MHFVLVEPISIPKYAFLTALSVVQNRYQPQWLKDERNNRPEPIGSLR